MNYKKSITLLIILISISFIATSQEKELPIKELNFLVGEWEGKGWMMGREGKNEYIQHELVTWEASEEVLLVKGKGWTLDKTKEIHSALGMISYDKMNEKIKFIAYKKGQGLSESVGDIIGENMFRWYLQGIPNVEIRFTANLNDKGQWHEIGEMKRGDTWVKIMEMELNRID